MAADGTRMPGVRRPAMALLGLFALVALSGCTSPGPVAPPSPSPSSESTSESTPEPTPADTIPAFDPSGGAAGNLDYFDYVNGQVLASNAAPAGGSFPTALAAAGFDRAAMEVTPDRTAVDLEAASVQFSVRMADGCLVGQWGADIGYHSQETPVLASGRCLIGSERPVG